MTRLAPVNGHAVGHRDSNVLLLLNSLSVGGSEQKAVRLANDLVGRMPQIVLAYLNPPDSLQHQVSPGVVTACLGRNGKFSISALRALGALIREHDIRTVFAINLYPALYATLAKLTARRRLRLVVAVNATELTTPKERRQMLLYRRLLRCADAVVFGADFQRRLWIARYGVRVKSDAAHVLYNGVDTSRFNSVSFTAERHKYRPAARFVVGTVGQMRPEKSQIELVRAVRELRARGLDVGAILVGDGPERTRVEREIRDSGIEPHVRVVGEVYDVRPYLAAMDVFVLPSLTETFSNAALEAMAMARPVGAARVGGMEEMLQFGGGFTYPPGDLKLLCDHLAGLFGNERELALLGEQARTAVLGHFSWSSMVDNYLRVMVRAPAGAVSAS